jgi:hypothetical protein
MIIILIHILVKITMGKRMPLGLFIKKKNTIKIDLFPFLECN